MHTDPWFPSERENDLRKLVELQHEGDIARIYTKRMFPELKEDLEDLRRDHHLPQHSENSTIRRLGGKA